MNNLISDGGMGSVQLFKMRLLGELDAFCRKYAIAYSVIDELFALMVRKEDLSVSVFDVSVVMTPENYFRYLSAVEKFGLAKDRVIENIFNNLNYPSTSTRYVATNTLSVNLIATPYLYNGLHVTIKLLRPGALAQVPGLSKVTATERRVKKVVSYLGRPLGLAFYPVLRRFKRKITARMNAARRIDANTDTRTEYLYRFKSGPALSIPAVALDKNLDFSYDDIHFRAYAYLFTDEFVSCAGVGSLTFARKRPQIYVESASVSFDEYASSVGKCSRFLLYVNGFFDWFLLRRIRRVEKSDYSMNKFLRAFSFKFYLYKFSREFAGKVDYISCLAREGKYEELRAALGSYPQFFNYFLSKRKLLVFDQQVFEAYLQLLRVDGHSAKVETVLVLFARDFEAHNEKDVL